MSNEANDDIRPRGTVMLDCEKCEWSFWVDPLHPMLDGKDPKICPTCSEQAATKAEPQR